MYKIYGKYGKLFFQPIFIRFSHCFVQKNFTLSSEIKLDQLWTSPLNTKDTKTK